VTTMKESKQNDGNEVGSPAMWLPDRRSFVRGIVGLGGHDHIHAGGALGTSDSKPEHCARWRSSAGRRSMGSVHPLKQFWAVPGACLSSFPRCRWVADRCAYDLQWQALAKKWDCALLGPSYHVLNDAIDLTPGGAELWFDPRKGSNATFLRALKELSIQSGYPEIATAPWVLWGHSGGGIWSNVMSTLHPERIVAVFLRSGTATMFRTMHEFIQPEVPPATYGIPTMVNFGMGEKGKRPYDGSLATFQEYGAQGAPIGFAPDPAQRTSAATRATWPSLFLMSAYECASRNRARVSDPLRRVEALLH